MDKIQSDTIVAADFKLRPRAPMGTAAMLMLLSLSPHAAVLKDLSGWDSTHVAVEASPGQFIGSAFATMNNTGYFPSSDNDILDRNRIIMINDTDRDVIFSLAIDSHDAEAVRVASLIGKSEGPMA
jgi:hypothetical protein